MQNDIDTWYLESMFARFRSAAHLVDCIEDASITDELAKTVNEICHRLAALLGKPYGQQATEEPAGSQGTEEPTEDDKPDELELANMVDELSDLVAQADAFGRAAESCASWHPSTCPMTPALPSRVPRGSAPGGSRRTPAPIRPTAATRRHAWCPGS